MTIDHKGRLYEFLDDMLIHYGISLNTYKRRKELGYTDEECLVGVPTAVYDHRGIEYPNYKALCNHYRVDIALLVTYLDLGYSLFECLENPALARVIDHNNTEYKSVSDMCKAYNVLEKAFFKRLRKEKDLKYALTGILDSKLDSKKSVWDSLTVGLGNIETTSNREVKKSKTQPKGKKQTEKKKKAKGEPKTIGTVHMPYNHFSCIIFDKECKFIDAKEACEYMRIPLSMYNRNRVCGLSVTEALMVRKQVSAPVKRLSDPIINETGYCVDCYGNRYESFYQMCLYYGVSAESVSKALKQGFSLIEALSIVPITATLSYPDEIAKENYARSKQRKPLVSIRTGEVKDFARNRFANFYDACAYWGISVTVYDRLARKYGSTTISHELLEDVRVTIQGKSYKGYKGYCKKHDLDFYMYMLALFFGYKDIEARCKAREFDRKVWQTTIKY